MEQINLLLNYGVLGLWTFYLLYKEKSYIRIIEKNTAILERIAKKMNIKFS
jgi:hypothetical protein